MRLSPAAWFRKGVGITVTGAGVSQWDDQSGNARHLLQAVDASRPALQADGSVLFNGTSHFLKAGAFTLNQPFTAYIAAKAITWAVGGFLLDGDAGSSTVIYQNVVSPAMFIFAGLDAAQNNGLAVGTTGVISAVFNGASSLLQVNLTTPTTGNAGSNNAAGLTLCARGTGLTGFANIQVAEVIIFPAAHDAAKRALVYRYLAGVGGL